MRNPKLNYLASDAVYEIIFGADDWDGVAFYEGGIRKDRRSRLKVGFSLEDVV